MVKKRLGWIGLVLVALMIGALPLAAQSDAEPELVGLTAPDGLGLTGEFYAPELLDDDAETGAPAVLLLHMLNSQRAAWDDFVPDLLAAGYAVLAVDMRGHGETGGTQDWPLAESDVQLWLDWLRDQPDIDPARLNIVGGSIGANLALRAMANDEAVITAVALSPGLDYRAVTTADALEAIDDRPVYLAASQGDTYSADSVKDLTALAAGDTLVRVFATRAHGTSIFMLEDTLAPSIVTWLDWQNR
jgi:dipeptidyl aminopeptidase/acylaminoacyl peptidase